MDKPVVRLAKQYLAKLHPLDWGVLNTILDDEVRWGTRGESNHPTDKVFRAVFDSKGDANKFRRLAIRAGYQASGVKVENITAYPGDDYVVTIYDRAD